MEQVDGKDDIIDPLDLPVKQGWVDNDSNGLLSRAPSIVDSIHHEQLSDRDNIRKSTISNDSHKAIGSVKFGDSRSRSSSIRSTLFYNSGKSKLSDEIRFTEDYYDENALWIFPLKSRFRRFCIKITESKYFEYFIIVLIVTNCAFLACDRPKPQRDCGDFSSTTRELIYLMFYVFEMIIKIIALGFIAYLSDTWNKMDCFIVVTGLISWMSGADSFGMFRVFRILRPLRLLTNMRGMRNLVVGFFESIPLLLNTLALLFFIFLMWGLVGVSIFGEGRFEKFCQSKSVANVFRFDDASGCNERFNYPKKLTSYNLYDMQVGFGQCIQDTNGTYFAVVKENGTNHVTYYQYTDPCLGNPTWSNRCPMNTCCRGSNGSPLPNESQNLYIEGEYSLDKPREWHWTRQKPTCTEEDGLVACNEGDECVNTRHSAFLNFVSFDNLPIAILTIFQILTLEDWWKVLEATLPSQPYNTFEKVWEVIFIYIFFISLVFFGSFFVLNLTIVAIKAKLFPKEENDGQRKSFTGGFTRASIYVRSVPMSKRANEIIQTNWFNRLFMMLIILNTIVLGSYRYDMSRKWENILDITNYVLTVLFVFEMILKIVGLGLFNYWAEPFNIFDGLVAIFAFVEMIILLQIDSADGVGLSAFRLLRLFRLFRVVRVVKLVRYFETLQRIIWVISCSIESIINIAMLLFLFIFSFALMGMTLFGQSFEEHYPPNTDRTTFENFLSAWIAVFQVLTLEGWVDVMRNTVRQTNWWSCCFFIAWIVIGVYCLYNMFLAIVLQNFEQDQKRQLEKRLKEKREQIGNNTDLSPRILKRTNLSEVLLSQSTHNVVIDLEGRYRWRLFCACRKQFVLEEFQQRLSSELQDEFPLEGEVHSEIELQAKKSASKLQISPQKLKLKPLKNKWRDVVKSDAFECMKKFDKIEKNCGIAAAADILADQHELKNKIPELPNEPLFPEDHILIDYHFYEPLAKFVFGKLFQTIIAFMIAASTIALAMDHGGASEKLNGILHSLDMAFLVLFTTEMILKIVVMGFVGRPDAYLGDSWNVLDFFVVITSILSTINTSGSLLPAFRALRAFRPLRLLSRNEGMRVVTKALFRSLPAMINVVAVTLLVWLIFAICGVEILNGRLHDCYDAHGNEVLPAFTEENYAQYARDQGQTPVDGEFFSACHACASSSTKLCARDMENYPTDKKVCAWLGGTWERSSFNFDDVPNAMVTLFVVSTLEGWVEIMWTAVDSNSVFDCRPIKDSNRYMALYFMIFIIIGSFFFVSLFVGVVFDNFVKLRDEEMGLGLLTDRQKNWVQGQMMVLKAKPVIVPQPPDQKISPEGKRVKSENWRMPFYRLTLNPNFEKLVMVCIVLNVTVMCFDTHPIKDWKRELLKRIDIVFTTLFTIEMIIKLIGLGPFQYVSDNWNKFDFVIVIGAWIHVGLEGNVENLAMLPMLRILRLFRVSRLIRLVKSMQRLKMLLRTLIISLPSLANVGTLLILMYSVSAIFFMNILGDIDQGGECINTYVNFGNFARALSTLFTVSTGDNWQCIMEEACTDFHPSYLCFMTFELFYVIVTFVTLNLFIAIIIDNFAIVAVEDNEEDDEYHEMKLTEDMVAKFSDAWAQLDPAATKFIPHTEFTVLLTLLDPPLGIGANATRMQILKMVNRVNVPVHDNAMIHYGEVLFALAKYHCGAKLPSDTKIYNKLQRQLTKKLPKFGTDDQVAINTIHAVLKCQRLWRTKTLKKKLARVKRQYSSVEKQRELIKKEVEKHFGERKKEEPIIIAKRNSPNKKQNLITKPESSKPPVAQNGWFNEPSHIVQKGELSPLPKGITGKLNLEGQITDIEHLKPQQPKQSSQQIIININIQQMSSNQHSEPIEPRTYKALLKHDLKEPANKIPPLDFSLG